MKPRLANPKMRPQLKSPVGSIFYWGLSLLADKWVLIKQFHLSKTVATLRLGDAARHVATKMTREYYATEEFYR